MADEQQKGPAVPLKERFQVYPDVPLPELATPSAQAFKAEDRLRPGRQFFALIGRPGFPARINVMRTLKGMECPGLMTLMEWGVMDWPPAGRKVMAVVYERPAGGRVMNGLASEFRPIPEAEMVKKVIRPMTEALKKLRALNITHRAIRPTNMFWWTENDHVVLGDCTISPPAFDQPGCVEPLESCQCIPAGRGVGSYVDDSYAFGASIVMLLQGGNPVAKQDEAAVLRVKMLNGSYAALVGDARMPPQMIEMLRGLLVDDPAQRWHVEGLEQWLSGRRAAPLVVRNEKHAGRAFNFNGKDYVTGRELALAFSMDFDAATQVIADGQLEQWLRRSLDSPDKATAVGDAVRIAVTMAADKKQSLDYMVAKVCMILDGSAPIRYKGLRFLPDGLGPLLAVTVVDGGDVNLIAEAILRSVVRAWTETREISNRDHSAMERIFNAQRTFLERTAIGNGIERLIYEMNDTMPCLSSYVANDYVLDTRSLLLALNVAARKAESKSWPIDRHVGAFIAARTSFDIERVVFELSNDDPSRVAQAMLSILANLQWRAGLGGLTSLAGWVGGLMGPVIGGFHNRDVRKQLEKEVLRTAKDGNLVEMARILDSSETRTFDRQGYEQARQDWAAMAAEIRRIEMGEAGIDEENVRTAQQIAALISVTIAFITIVLLLIARFVDV